MNKYILLFVLVGLLSESMYSQPTFEEKISGFDDICFCEVGLSHPMEILGLDNNMEILFALQTGKTLHELDKLSIKFTESQLNLLELSGLIERRDSVYQTLIPILSKAKTLQLREETRKMAGDIIPQFKDDFEGLIETLNSRKLQKNSYSLFFAFVLDGLVWDILEQSNDIEETNITEEKPFWDGTFWMIEPKREFSCGTNSLSAGDYSINVNWSDESVISVRSYKLLSAFLFDYIEHGKITQPAIFEEFAENDLFDENGELQIPIIKADSTDTIYLRSKRIAQKVVRYLRNDIDYSVIIADRQNLTKGQKITVLYHEMMWDILDIMERNGQLRKPIAFEHPQDAKTVDLKDLLFIVKD